MKNNIITLAALALTLSLDAQDSRYTQAFANPLRLNPALMGPSPDLKAILHYRSQWANIDNGYTTYSFSVMSPFYFKEQKEKLDIGLNFNSDKAGAFKTTDFSLSAGYNIKLSSANYLSAAIQAGYVQKSLDLGNLTFDEQYINGSYSASNTRSEVITYEKRNYADAAFGLLWFNNATKAEGAKINAYAGFSGYHVNRPNESFLGKTSRLPMRFSYIAGVKILGDGDVDFTPAVRVTQQKGAEEIAAGLTMDYRVNATAKFVVGAWYRSHDAIAVGVGFEHKNFTLGYSYDIVTDLNNYSASTNANEFSISYKLNMAEKKNVKVNASPTPSFY